MKKKLLSLALALALCLGLTVPAFAAEVKIVEVPVPTVEGYEVTPKYIGWSNFSEGLALLWDSVEETGSLNYCYIDRTGKVVIPPAGYDYAVDFSEGMAAVVKNSKVGFIDTTGKEVIPCTYDEVHSSFSQGLVGVKKNGKWGFIDKTGELVIPCTFDSVGSFCEGMAAVVKNSKVGFIDQAGETVIDFQYDDAYGFSQGLAAVQKGGKWGFIDKTEEVVIGFTYDSAYAFSEGLAPVKQGSKWGYIDRTGELVIPCKFEGAGYFSDGLAPVAQNNKIGFIDKTGKLVVPCKYDNFAPFSEGFAAVGVTVGLTTMWGIIDKTGKEVVTPTTHTEDGAEYFINDGGDSGPIFSEGYAVAHRGGEWKDNYEDRWFYFAITVDAEVSDWAREQVDLAAAKGLMPDVLGDDFTVNITRAEFAALSVELYEAMSGEEAPAPGDSPFSDTDDPVIIQANALGIVNGKGGGKFAPDDLVTRQEAALMLSRVYTRLGGQVPTVAATTFADNGDVASWARDAVAFMSDNKIVNGKGDNKFDPLGNASIQEAMVIALRMFENLDVE